MARTNTRRAQTTGQIAPQEPQAPQAPQTPEAEVFNYLGTEVAPGLGDNGHDPIVLSPLERALAKAQEDLAAAQAKTRELQALARQQEAQQDLAAQQAAVRAHNAPIEARLQAEDRKVARAQALLDARTAARTAVAAELKPMPGAARPSATRPSATGGRVTSGAYVGLERPYNGCASKACGLWKTYTQVVGRKGAADQRTFTVAAKAAGITWENHTPEALAGVHASIQAAQGQGAA